MASGERKNDNGMTDVPGLRDGRIGRDEWPEDRSLITSLVCRRG